MKAYALHIPQSDFSKVYGNDELTAVLKRHDFAVSEWSKNPQLYCASLLFKTPELRDAAMVDLKAAGVHPIREYKPAYFDDKYAPPEWK